MFQPRREHRFQETQQRTSHHLDDHQAGKRKGEEDAQCAQRVLGSGVAQGDEEQATGEQGPETEVDEARDPVTGIPPDVEQVVATDRQANRDRQREERHVKVGGKDVGNRGGVAQGNGQRE